MRILVLSDSHGHASALEEIIEKNPEIQHVFFLGDVIRDIETAQLLYPKKSFYKVAGNCDFFSDYFCEATITLGGIKIFYCHGHTVGVKQGTDHLLARAQAEKAQLALYGHTHQPNISFHEGMILVNPGSVAQPREGRSSYAVVDIEGTKIFPSVLPVCE